MDTLTANPVLDGVLGYSIHEKEATFQQLVSAPVQEISEKNQQLDLFNFYDKNYGHVCLPSKSVQQYLCVHYNMLCKEVSTS